MLVNLERTRNLMEQYGLDALIATHPHNVFYLSGFPIHPIYEGPPCPCLWNTPVYVVLPIEKNIEPTIIIPKIQLDYYFACNSWIKDFRCYGEFYVFKADDVDPAKLSPLEVNLMGAISDTPTPTITEVLIKVIEEKGLSKGHLGLDERGLTIDVYENIKHKLSDATIVNSSGFFYEMKIVKTSEEISRIRRGAEINTKAIRAVIESISPGVTEKDLNELYALTVMNEGAYFVNALIGGGTRASVVLAPGWLPSKKPLKRGDAVRMDCYLVYQNYISDVARTSVIGKPSEKLSKYHNALLNGHMKAINTIAPGVNASKVFDVAMEKTIEGIPHYKRPHIGHSIGIECYSPLLSISPYCDIELQENMVINLESPYYELGFGGINIEGPILVTKNGCEDLTANLSKELHIKV